MKKKILNKEYEINKFWCPNLKISSLESNYNGLNLPSDIEVKSVIKFELNKCGAKVEAYTMAVCAESCCISPPKTLIDLVLDKNFVFMICKAEKRTKINKKPICAGYVNDSKWLEKTTV